MNTSEVLNRAADLIEELGWTRGTWGIAYNGEPVLSLCTEGAILAASGVGERWYSSYYSQRDEISAREILDSCPATQAIYGYLDYNDIADWNDDDGRTQAEVIEVLRACAVIEASREREAAEVSA